MIMAVSSISALKLDHFEGFARASGEVFLHGAQQRSNMAVISQIVEVMWHNADFVKQLHKNSGAWTREMANKISVSTGAVHQAVKGFGKSHLIATANNNPIGFAPIIAPVRGIRSMIKSPLYYTETCHCQSSRCQTNWCETNYCQSSQCGP